MTNSVIELKINNHPGVMSHITGLFARRSFNLGGILCWPTKNTDCSQMYLLVRTESGLDQILRQLCKLYDVLDVRIREDFDQEFFKRLD